MSRAGALAGVRALNIMLGAGAGGLEAMALNVDGALRTQGAAALSVGVPGSWFTKALADRPDAFAALRQLTPFDPTAPARLRGLAKGLEPNLVIAHGSRAVSLALKAYRGRAPIAAMVHNFRAKADLAGVDLALCVSPAVARDVTARFPQLATTVVENFEALAAGPSRAPWTGRPRLGSVGRLHRNKGYDLLLDAAALLRDRGMGFSLTLVGDGPERAALERQAATLNLTDRVAFLGWLENPSEALRAMDLFVLSSRVEPFGLVVIEAMAAGLPVVSTDIGGPRDILAGGRLGRLVPAGSAQALADGIAAVLADPAAALETARVAQAEALARYSMDAGGRRIAESLARFRPSPPG
jgi:glycosyltransferase involved in cell wall biosynthesis